MTAKQEKLIESYIRKEVRRRLNESVDMRIVAIVIEKAINEIDSKSSGVTADENEIPAAIVKYLNEKYYLKAKYRS